MTSHHFEFIIVSRRSREGPAMDIKSTRTLSNGQLIPILGFGTWQSDPGVVGTAVECALRQGVRHVDCAAIYYNEKEVGDGIKASGVKREDVFITSKLWNHKHHPDDVEAACRQTMADLGVDYIDLYLMHFPSAFKRGDDYLPKDENGDVIFDSSLHPTDTWLAMEKLVEKGLVRSLGMSNFNSLQIEDIIKRGNIRPVMLQVECHPYFQQHKLLNWCKQNGLAMTAYSPLVNGRSEILKDPRLEEIAKRYNKSTAQIILRWHLQRGLIIIPKSVFPNEIEENGKLFDFR